MKIWNVSSAVATVVKDTAYPATFPTFLADGGDKDDTLASSPARPSTRRTSW